MTAIEITAKFRSIRTGRMETWAVRSTDGVWTYERDEDTGTLWAVTHVPTGRWTYYPSLPKARKDTADGSLKRYFDITNSDGTRRR